MGLANRNNAATSESASNQTVAASARGAGAPPPMFAIDPFDKTKSKWMRWVECLKNAFVIYGISDELMQILTTSFVIKLPRMFPVERHSTRLSILWMLISTHSR